jgi:hypothetical protein
MGITPSSSGYQQVQWHIHDTRQRVFAASLAFLITVFLSLQFKIAQNKKSENEFLNRPFTLLMLQMMPAIRPKVENQTAAPKSAVNKLSLIPTPAIHAEKVSDTPSPINVESTPQPSAEKALTLLTINSKSITKAYNDSKSEIQKMAEASSKELNTPSQTKYDRFQTAAEEAVIPDCISANAGGTLLSIPVLAYKALADKCK